MPWSFVAKAMRSSRGMSVLKHLVALVMTPGRAVTGWASTFSTSACKRMRWHLVRV